MKLVPYFSKAPLSRFIELIWAVKGTSNYTREKVLPNGAIELIINFSSYHKVVSKVDDRQFEVYRESWIAGMQEDYILAFAHLSISVSNQLREESKACLLGGGRAAVQLLRPSPHDP